MNEMLVEERAFDALVSRGGNPQQVVEFLNQLSAAGFTLAEQPRDEFVVRWVSVAERPVPPEADTIIRTITRTVGAQSWSGSFWLQGLRGPQF